MQLARTIMEECYDVLLLTHSNECKSNTKFLNELKRKKTGTK